MDIYFLLSCMMENSVHRGRGHWSVPCGMGLREKRHYCLQGGVTVSKGSLNIMLLLRAKSPQLCPTLCDPVDGSPPGSPVPGILQARILEWVAISFSKAWKWKVKVKSLSHVQLFVTPWTVAYQAPLSMGFSRQEYWGGFPFPSPLNIMGKL